MQIIKHDKVKETLFTNWTKYIDYKELSALITNTLQLYASNWTTIAASKNFSTKKIYLSKVDYTPDNSLLFWFSFELPWKENTAVGTIELVCALGANLKVSQITGTFYLNNA